MTPAGEPDEADGPEDKPLFREPGAGWYWLLAGPAAAVALIMIEQSSHKGVSLLVPGFFLVLVSAFLAIQIKAARLHTSVELTPDALRQGTETLLVSEIVRVYPEAENTVRSGEPLEHWQTARTLGEISGVPRGRVAVGLKLTGGRTAQAWARRHRHLRQALTPLVQERVSPKEVPKEVEVLEVDDDGLPE
jgi:hypothetical protein